MAKGSRFGSKPAAGLDVIGQNLAFEQSSRSVSKQGLQLGRGINRWHNSLFRRPAAFDWRLQGDPVMGMRTERDDVGGIFDCARQLAAKKFHRHTSANA